MFSPARVCCCQSVLIFSTVLLWLIFQLQSMLWYETEKHSGGRLVGRLSPDAYDCKHAVEPSWPDVAMLTSFWMEHPCARTNHALCLGAGARSSRFPAIWDAARRNQAASARAWNTTYIAGGGKKETATGAICKNCLLYTSPSPRDATLSRMPSSA